MITITSNVPERIRKDYQKSVAYMMGESLMTNDKNSPGYAETSAEWEKIVSEYPALKEMYGDTEFMGQEELIRKLPDRDKSLVRCLEWGRAVAFSKFKPAFKESPIERERTGSMDAYEYMLRLPYILGIPPNKND